jgi:fructose-specific PTS system IIC-like component
MAVYYIIGDPIAGLMKWLSVWLGNMQGASFIILGTILGCMIAVDMGGPMNKTAFFFAVALISTNPQLMAAVAAADCTPPLGLALATFLFKDIFNDVEREAGKPAVIMGFMGITEGAIPFAAADPVRVIPAIMLRQCGRGNPLTMVWRNAAPWGGLSYYR